MEGRKWGLAETSKLRNHQQLMSERKCFGFCLTEARTRVQRLSKGETDARQRRIEKSVDGDQVAYTQDKGKALPNGRTPYVNTYVTNCDGRRRESTG